MGDFNPIAVLVSFIGAYGIVYTCYTTKGVIPSYMLEERDTLLVGL